MTGDPYPRDCWYVAATSEEIGTAMSSRRILDRQIALRRRPSGEVVAFADRCPHRGYPLSRGRVDGDRVICGYHGFCFDGDGACVEVPSQPNVPYGASVRAYPVREVPPFVWIWTGDPRFAARRGVPRLPWLTEPGWASSGVIVDVAANYLLIHDHYLDLTHAPVMHPEMVGPGLELPTLDEVQISELSVSLSRELPPTALAAWEAELTGLSTDAPYRRRHYSSFLTPAVVVEGWVVDLDRPEPYEQVRIQAVTPQTATSTRLFWQVTRNYALDSADVGVRLHDVLEGLLRRDMATVEAIEDDPDTVAAGGHVKVSADAAMLKARSIVASMLSRERATSRHGQSTERVR